MSAALSPAETRAYQANIWKFYIQTFLLNFQLWYPIWIIYLQEERGLTLGQVTLVEVPHLLTVVVLQIPAAAIADRWGRRTTLALGALLSAMGVTLFGLADTYLLILFSYLVWGAAFALMSGSDSAFLYDSLKALGREDDYQRILRRRLGRPVGGEPGRHPDRRARGRRHEPVLPHSPQRGHRRAGLPGRPHFHRAPALS